MHARRVSAELRDTAAQKRQYQCYGLHLVATTADHTSGYQAAPAARHAPSSTLSYSFELLVLVSRVCPRFLAYALRCHMSSLLACALLSHLFLLVRGGPLVLRAVIQASCCTCAGACHLNSLFPYCSCRYASTAYASQKREKNKTWILSLPA